MSNIHHSVCSVIPPHVLRNVAERTDDDALRDSAEATLDAMHAFTAERERRLIATVPSTGAVRKSRTIYDAGHRLELPGKRVMREGGRRGTDVEVNEAYDGAGATHDFFYRLFGRRSIDGRGMRLDSTVHYGVRFDNALWNGRQMIYGDGDGKLFNRFTASLEVIAHEFTHGVTENMAGLGYSEQTGALNEHISDAFGIMVKQFTLGQTVEESDWLIGAGLLSPRVHGNAVRSMAAPGTAYDDPILGRDPQPAHMRDYQPGSADGGGVHINSGIPNHAFYLAAMAIGGYAWEVLAEIWFACLKSELTTNAQFHDLADASVTVAARTFGVGGRAHRAIENAWKEVGVPLSKNLPGRLRGIQRYDFVPVRPAWRWRRRPSVPAIHKQTTAEMKGINQ